MREITVSRKISSSIDPLRGRSEVLLVWGSVSQTPFSLLNVSRDKGLTSRLKHGGRVIFKRRQENDSHRGVVSDLGF